MAHPETPPKQKRHSFLNPTVFFFVIIILISSILIWSLWSITDPSIPSLTRIRHDQKTFYDDPTLSYSIKIPVKNWDRKRKQWLAKNPSHANRILITTGSQPDPCGNPIGDHLLLRSFKNKVDYCRIHACDVFYNNVLLDQGMLGYWAKYPVIRAAMMAHPEAEWIWWVDSDAIITDMDWRIPLEKYKGYNLVVPGWPELVFKQRSWVGLNAGVFLIRNCQWSMDLLDHWAEFGPTSKKYRQWGPILKSIFKDKLFGDSDDQSALGYILVKEGKKWGDKILLEHEYDLSAYWAVMVGKLDSVYARYKEAEKKVRRLRKRHAETDINSYETQWEEFLKKSGFSSLDKRRPFVTHFTGCQPCNGNYNPMYTGKDCWEGMAKALNFADNQVLRNFGYSHPDLGNTSFVQSISFD